MYAALVTRFQQAFPGIRTGGTFAIGPQQQSRVQAERSGGRYIPDIWINGSTVALRGLKTVGALAPLEPLIVLPEIRDRHAWLQNKLWWNDAKAPLMNISFEGFMYPPAYVNTTLVKPSDFKSYWDLADPKWKGKVCATDIRSPGPGGVPARFIYKHPALGQPWFERFFGTLDVALGREQRQLVDWVSEGRYPIAVFVDTDEAHGAILQGLPIAPIQVTQLKEGGPVAPGGGTLSVMNPAPHPNAAKLYVNWLLSREGQIAWQEETATPSLRMDIPKKDVYLAPELKPGLVYTNGGSEEYSLLTGAIFNDMISTILKKAGRAV